MIKFTTNRKIPIILFTILAALFIFLAVPVATACTNARDTELNVNNYAAFIGIRLSSTLIRGGGYRSRNVTITRAQGVTLSNVIIQYEFVTVVNGVETSRQFFSENLGSLSQQVNHYVIFFVGETSWGAPMPQANNSIHVLAVSGTIVSVSNNNNDSLGLIIFAIILGVITVVVLVVVVVVRIRFNKKFDSITTGMTHSCVIGILGEPNSATQAQGIITCIWSRQMSRYRTQNYVITFKDNKVISIDTSSSGWL